jgi:hypothetical protein
MEHRGCRASEQDRREREARYRKGLSGVQRERGNWRHLSE